MNKRRLLLLLPAGVSLVAALDAGLFRLGWRLPLPQVDLPLAHGPLMVSAFLGTLIGLEKAVALGKSWAYLGPLATGMGGLWLVVATGAAAPRLLFFAGSLALAAMAGSFLRRHRTMANAYILAGAVLWWIGNGFWLSGWSLFAVVPAWIGFLLLVIAGERFELNRLMRPSLASRSFFSIATLAAVVGITIAAAGYRFDSNAFVLFTARGDVLDSTYYAFGVRLLGGALIALGLWLLANDMARAALKRPGLTRFIGVNLLLGYAWLVATGALWLAEGAVVGGVSYDAVLHGFFLGFVFSMIFAHGPVIFPAILQRPLPFRRSFYGHVAVLHAGLGLRWIGDLADVSGARSWGGLLNAAALLLFVAATVLSLVRAPRKDIVGSK